MTIALLTLAATRRLLLGESDPTDDPKAFLYTTPFVQSPSSDALRNFLLNGPPPEHSN